MTAETYGDEMKAVEERTSDRLLRRALSAAEDQGFYVFPVVRHGKVPAFKRWQEQATLDATRIHEWFQQRAFNIGVATGPSRLVVVDLDDAHGAAAPEPWTGARHGRDVLTLLAAAANKAAPWNTYTVSTPSGGLHLYFRPPPDVVLRNTIGTVGWRIDTRAHGGFVVAAGSVRRDGCYRVINAAPVAPLPGWLLHALASPPPPAPAAPLELSRVRAGSYVRAAVEAECRLVSDAATGTRHRTLLRAARILGEFVGGGNIDLGAAHAALRQASARHIGVDGCTTQEVERTISDGLAYGQRNPRTIMGGSHA